ncbi:MAG: FHA domain-containing protein, partial [Eubacteriales bacterium]
MKLTLLSKQEYRSITLPATCMGQYWIRGVNAQKKLENIVAVEAVPPTEATGQGFWRLKSNRRFKILKTGADPLQSSPLKAGEFYKIKSADGMQTFVLYSEPLTEDRKRYDQYNLSSSLHKISIGRRSSNNICYDNPYVGSAHAELVFSQQGIVLQDLSSLNHTYVNGKACQSALLQNGDMIYMMGLQIVVTSKSLFVNNPDGKVQIQGLLQCPLEAVEDRPLAPNLEEEDEFENIEPDFYYRPPRFKYDVEPYELKIDAPPSNQNNDEIPLIMMIGPSMTMGMASVASGTYAVTSAIARGDITSAIPSIVMCFSMLLGTMMWPILTKSYQRKRKAKKEEKRQISYRAYLEKIDQEIAKEIESQEDILRDNDADINNYVTRILAKNPLMWERTPKHSDFLSLRLGYGNLPFQGDIKYPERRFTVEEDNLTELVYQFGEQPRWLTNVPICLPLIERFVSGIYGDKATMIRYAKQLILQIVALHSYDEVKLVLLYDELDRDTFSFTRWLPHTMDDQRTARYIATNAEETKELSSLLDGVIERRKNMRDSGLDDESPYYVMICLDKDLAGRTECVKRIIGYKNNLKFSVISMFPRLKDLPKECTAVLELCPGSEGNLTLIGDVSEPPIPLRLDVGLNVDSQ